MINSGGDFQEDYVVGNDRAPDQGGNLPLRFVHRRSSREYTVRPTGHLGDASTLAPALVMPLIAVLRGSRGSLLPTET